MRLNYKGIQVYLFLLILVALVGAIPVRAAEKYQITGTAGTAVASDSATAVTGTPGPSSTPENTATPSQTLTLMPLPALTLIFPAATQTPRPSATPPSISPTAPGVSLKSGGEELTSRIRLLVLVTIISWLLLAGFLIVFLRQYK